jgi:hypothetical protein
MPPETDRLRKTRIFHVSARVVDILLVEGPADALRHAALDLPLDIARVYGASDVLSGDETQYLHLAGLRIDLDVAELGGEAGCHHAGIYRRLSPQNLYYKTRMLPRSRPVFGKLAAELDEIRDDGLRLASPVDKGQRRDQRRRIQYRTKDDALLSDFSNRGRY